MALVDALKEVAQKLAEGQKHYEQVQSDSYKELVNAMAKNTGGATAAQPAPVAQNAPVTTDTRTTAQKMADAQSAYDLYMASEERKKAQQEQNRQRMQAAINNAFAAPGTSVSDMPLNIVSPKPEADAKEKELKTQLDYYKGQQQKEDDQKALETKLTEYESWSAADKDALDQYIMERDQEQNNWFMADTSPSYNAVTAKLVQDKGLDEVRKMAEAVTRSRNAKIAEETDAAAQKVAQEHPFIGSGLAVGANLLGAMGGTVGAATQFANKTGQFSTLDANDVSGIASRFGSGVTQNVSQQIAGTEGNRLRQLAAMGYEGIMSAADSGARLAAAGFNPGVAAFIAASGGFSNALRQYSAQGASPGQAAAAALVTAGIEYATEKIPMDELVKVGQSKTVARDILKQAFITEPTTEEISLFSTAIAESAILQDKSSRNQEIGELVAGGMSYEEAKNQANKSMLMEALKTYLVSAFSGGFSAGGAAITNAAIRNQAKENAAPVATGVAVEQQVADQVAAPVTEAQPAQESMTQQQAVDEQAAKILAQMPKAEPVQKTPGQVMVQNAVNEALGVEPEAQKNATETGGIWNRLRSYSQKERDNWKSSKRIVLCDSIEQFRDFVSKALTSKDQTHKKMYFGAINTDLAAEISNATGVDVEGYNLSLGEDEVRKINKSHGNESKEALRGQRAVTEADYLAIPDIVQNADYIKRSDSDYEGKPAIEFQKRNGNEVTTVVAVVSDKRLDVFVQTAYINKKNNGSIATPESVQADSFTSKTTGGTAPMTTAPSLVGDAEAYRDTSETQAKSDTVLNDIIPNANTEVKGTGAAEANFSGKAAYQDLLTDDNVQRSRATDARDVEMPKTDTSGNPVSEVVGNVTGSKFTPDEFVSLIQERVPKGDFSYAKITNNQATQNAIETITKSGSWEQAYSNWVKEVDRGIAGAEISARGTLLLNHAAQGENKALWIDVLGNMQKLGTNTAQGLQAMRLIRELSPPDKLEFAKWAVRNMVADMKLHTDITIDEDLLTAYENAETDEQRNQIMSDIEQNVADQIPSTLLDKWNSMRYMNMLGNLKTPIRNVGGNVANAVAYRLKDHVAAIIEDVVSVVNPEIEQTKAHLVGKDLLDVAKGDFENVESAISSGKKYSGAADSSSKFEQNVMEKRTVFKNPILEGYRKATDWIMNNEYFGDVAFGRAAYARALAGYLKAHNVTADQFQKMVAESDAFVDKARAYAIQQAQEATFHDNSALARIVGNAQKSAGVIGQGIMPFTKTPANVLTRAEEFSPMGIVNTAVKAAQKAASKTKMAEAEGAAGNWARAGAEITGADIADSLAKTLTGTGLFVLGAALYNHGFLTGGPDEDEEKANFDELTGKQNYAIVFPDGTNYTMDWLTPVAIPMFMGAEFMKVAGQDKDLSFSDLEQIFTSIADPMIQMSMMQSVNDSLNSIKYAENNLGQFVLNAAVSYLTQGLTNTLMGQIERSTEQNRMTTYVDKESSTPQWLQRQLGKASQKIPLWDYQQMEYRNAFGQTEENEGGLFYNLISPGYLSKEQETALTDELYRLRSATGEKVFPQTPEKTVTYTDASGNKHTNYALTQDQLEKMQTAQGQTAARLLDEMITRSDYQKLTDAQKADAISAVYEYAKEQGRKAAFGNDYHSNADAWVRSANGNNVQFFIEWGAKSTADKAVADVAASLKNGWKVTDAAKKELNETYVSFAQMSGAAQQRVMDEANSATAKYFEIRSKGVGLDDYLDALKNLKKVDGNNNSQVREAIANAANSPEVTDKIMMAYMDDYDPNDEKPDKTELRYQYARQKLGMSAQDYAKAYKAYCNGSKKAEKINALIAAGFSKKDADTLYKLFQGGTDVVTWYNSKNK